MPSRSPPGLGMPDGPDASMCWARRSHPRPHLPQLRRYVAMHVGSKDGVKRHQELIPWRHKELTGEDYARAHGPVTLSGSAHPAPLARMRYRVWKVAACTTMSCSGRRSGAAGVHDDHPELLAEALENRLEVREPVQDQVDEDDRGLAAAVRVAGSRAPSGVAKANLHRALLSPLAAEQVRHVRLLPRA